MPLQVYPAGTDVDVIASKPACRPGQPSDQRGSRCCDVESRIVGSRGALQLVATLSITHGTLYLYAGNARRRLTTVSGTVPGLSQTDSEANEVGWEGGRYRSS